MLLHKNSCIFITCRIQHTIKLQSCIFSIIPMFLVSCVSFWTFPILLQDWCNYHAVLYFSTKSAYALWQRRHSSLDYKNLKTSNMKTQKFCTVFGWCTKNWRRNFRELMGGVLFVGILEDLNPMGFTYESPFVYHGIRVTNSHGILSYAPYSIRISTLAETSF